MRDPPRGGEGKMETGGKQPDVKKSKKINKRRYPKKE